MAKPDKKVNESEASATLKPTAEGGDAAKSRTAMLAAIIGQFAKVEHNDEVSFFDKVMSQFPLPEAGEGSASSNKSSVAMHGEELQQIISADVKSIFEGSELSDEFRSKATVLFEAAVAARVISEVEKEKERTVGLKLALSGRELAVAAALSPRERAEFAQALERAIWEARRERI